MCIPAKYPGVRPCRASSQQKLGKAQTRYARLNIKGGKWAARAKAVAEP